MFGQGSHAGFPTPEHFLPFLYTLGLKGERDTISYFNDKAQTAKNKVMTVLAMQSETKIIYLRRLLYAGSCIL